MILFCVPDAGAVLVERTQLVLGDPEATEIMAQTKRRMDMAGVGMMTKTNVTSRMTTEGKTEEERENAGSESGEKSGEGCMVCRSVV